jgi:hypothetical protein
MSSTVALTLTIEQDRSGVGLESLYQVVRESRVLRQDARATLEHHDPGPGEMSGLVAAAISLAPTVLALPGFLISLRDCLKLSRTIAPSSGPVTVTGARGSITFDGELTSAQFEQLIREILPADQSGATRAPEVESGEPSGTDAP